MTEERIIVEIDDSQLDAALLKIDLLGTKASGIIGGAAGGKQLATQLPRLNRELRIILGRMPGLRQTLAYYTRIQRLERGMVLGGAQFYLTIIATALILIREIQQQQKRNERQQQDYERLIRRARGWTHDEYVRGQAEWQEYRKSMPG